MPKGLKQTSELIAVGFRGTETAPNTFTQIEIDLNLDPLNQEVFVVQAVNLDVTPPDAIAGVDTTTTAALSSTSQSAVGTLNNSNVLARLDSNIRAAGFVDGGVGFLSQSLETPPAAMEYINIIATSNFFVQVAGTANLVGKTVSGKLYGYRARADASIYAALVQSEVLSN